MIEYDGYKAEVDTTKALQLLPEDEDIVQCLGEVVEEVSA